MTRRCERTTWGDVSTRDACNFSPGTLAIIKDRLRIKSPSTKVHIDTPMGGALGMGNWCMYRVTTDEKGKKLREVHGYYDRVIEAVTKVPAPRWDWETTLREDFEGGGGE